jgi:hypothetical protein
MNEATLLEPGSVYRRSTDVVARQVGGESILVPIRHNVGNLDYVYTLNAVAARVWSLLDGTRTIDAVVSDVCDEFDIDRGTALADISTLVSDLAGASLVSRER